MTATIMSSLRNKLRSRGGRWLATAALLAVVPKCFACLAAYLGLAAALSFGGPELCGAAENSANHWVSWLSLIALVCTLLGVVLTLRSRPAHPSCAASPAPH